MNAAAIKSQSAAVASWRQIVSRPATTRRCSRNRRPARRDPDALVDVSHCCRLGFSQFLPGTAHSPRRSCATSQDSLIECSRTHAAITISAQTHGLYICAACCAWLSIARPWTLAIKLRARTLAVLEWLECPRLARTQSAT